MAKRMSLTPVHAPRKQALRLAGIYLAVGILWILVSDRIADYSTLIGLSPASIQAVKGILYVFVTAAIAYGYISILLRRLNEAHQALLREHELVLGITEASPVGITVVDPDGQIAYANERAQQVLGLVRNEITARAYNAPEWEVTDYEGKPFPNEALPFHQVRTRRQTVRDIRHAIRRPDGRRVFLSINAAPLTAEGGDFGGMVAVTDDITDAVIAERERARQRQQHQSKGGAPKGTYQERRKYKRERGGKQWQSHKSATPYQSGCH